MTAENSHIFRASDIQTTELAPREGGREGGRLGERDRADLGQPSLLCCCWWLWWWLRITPVEQRELCQKGDATPPPPPPPLLFEVLHVHPVLLIFIRVN